MELVTPGNKKRTRKNKKEENSGWVTERIKLMG